MKRSLRESVGATISSGRLNGSNTTLLNALAMGADGLGSGLWRIKYGADISPQTVAKVKEALVLLLHGDRRRTPGPMYMLIVERALVEWADDRCPLCGGRKYIGSEYGDAKDIRARCPSGCVKGVASAFHIPGKARVFDDPAERAMNAVSCQRCGGKGWVPGVSLDVSRTRVCPRCDASGRTRLTDGKRARSLGLSLEKYQRDWASKYELALGIMRASDRSTGLMVANAMRTLEGVFGGGCISPETCG